MGAYDPRLDRLREYQERFVAKMLSCSLPHGNVLYCMDNETNTEAKWGQYWMAFIRQQADGRGVNVCVTDMFDDVWKPESSEMLAVALDSPELYDFLDISQVNSRNFGEDHWRRLHWIVQRAREHPRPVNHTKIYSAGETGFGSGTPQDGIERFWHNLLCGSASSRFHRPTSGIGLNEVSQACIRSARAVEELVRFWELVPAMELIRDRRENRSYLAASPGRAYVLFLPHGGPALLDLSEARAPLALTWIDVNSGQAAESTGPVGGEAAQITAPSELPWVAVLAANG
jgi:hypothetical protein